MSLFCSLLDVSTEEQGYFSNKLYSWISPVILSIEVGLNCSVFYHDCKAYMHVNEALLIKFGGRTSSLRLICLICIFRRVYLAELFIDLICWRPFKINTISAAPSITDLRLQLTDFFLKVWILEQLPTPWKPIPSETGQMFHFWILQF